MFEKFKSGDLCSVMPTVLDITHILLL
jgi:hypothetical protein